MLREHAPLIVLAVVTAVLFYLVFRNISSLRASLYNLEELLKGSGAGEEIEEAPVVTKAAAVDAAPLPPPSATPAATRQ